MGNVSEEEVMDVKLPDMEFLKNAIHYGVEHGQSLTEGKDISGGIGAFFGMFAGGAYLFHNYFPNPEVLVKYQQLIDYGGETGKQIMTTYMPQLQYSPMAVAGLGGLAAAILGCIAYNVVKKLINKKEQKVSYDGPKEPSNTGDAEKDNIIDKILALPNMDRRDDNWKHFSQFDTKVLKNYLIQKGGKL